MQYTTQETHSSWSMQKTVTKKTSHSKNVKCLKISKCGPFYKRHFSFLFRFVLFCFFFASRKLFTNFYKLSIFSTFKNGLVSRILAVFSIFFFLHEASLRSS